MCYFDSKLFGDSFKVIDDIYDILISQLKVIIVFDAVDDPTKPLEYYYEFHYFFDGIPFVDVEDSQDFIYSFKTLVNAHAYNNNMKLNLFVPTNGLSLLNNLTYETYPTTVIVAYASERTNFELKDCTLLEYIQSMKQNKNNNKLPNNTTSNNFTNINKNLKQINHKLDKILNKNIK